MFCLHVVTDEDFACVKAPPSKKAREDVKQEHNKSSSKSSSQETDSQSTLSQNSRWVTNECDTVHHVYNKMIKMMMICISSECENCI